MPSDKTWSTTALPRSLIHPMLVPFPVVCFIGAFLTDLAYWDSDDMQWANFSIWLLMAGLVMGGVAMIAGLIDLIRSRRSRRSEPAWFRMLGAVLAMAFSVVNAFVHSRDAYTAVVPTGMTLSGLVVLVMLVTGCLGWTMVRPREAGAAI